MLLGPLVSSSQRGRTCNNPAQLTRSYPPDGHDMHSMSTSVQNQDSFGVLPGPCAEESFVPARDTSCDNSSMLPQSQLTDSLYAPSSQYEQSHLLDQTAALFPMTSAPTMFAETSTGHLYPPPISPCSESLNHPYGSEADWRYSTSAMHNAASTKFDPVSLSLPPGPLFGVLAECSCWSTVSTAFNRIYPYPPLHTRNIHPLVSPQCLGSTYGAASPHQYASTSWCCNVERLARGPVASPVIASWLKPPFISELLKESQRLNLLPAKDRPTAAARKPEEALGRDSKGKYNYKRKRKSEDIDGTQSQNGGADITPPRSKKKRVEVSA